MLHFNLPTAATCLIVVIGGAIAAPALIKGFKRRGTGVKYEPNFLIQRAPQLAALLNVCFIVLGFLTYLGLMDGVPGAIPFLSCTNDYPQGICAVISWLGVLILLSGMVFMVGGWYSLGEALSTDAEVLDGQTRSQYWITSICYASDLFRHNSVRYWCLFGFAFLHEYCNCSCLDSTTMVSTG